MKLKSLIQSSWIQNIVLAIAVLATRSSLGGQVRVPTGSMEPTVQPGDHLLVNHAAYDFRLPFTQISIWKRAAPQRGDVIVFENPVRATEPWLLKRLIGLPGDTVEVTDGWVTLNGQRVRIEAQSSELYTEHLPGTSPHAVQRLGGYPLPPRKFVIPADQYLFLGDNRDNSSDGRVWGLVKHSTIIGRAERVLYNLAWIEKKHLPDLSFSRSGQTL